MGKKSLTRDPTPEIKNGSQSLTPHSEKRVKNSLINKSWGKYSSQRFCNSGSIMVEVFWRYQEVTGKNVVEFLYM